MVWRWDSSWDGLFSKAMLVSEKNNFLKTLQEGPWVLKDEGHLGGANSSHVAVVALFWEEVVGGS